MSNIPPLVPNYVDLTDFQFMAVDVQRLLKSDTWLAAIDNKLIAWACVNLWFESWHQKPAASLPSNDRLLARIAQCELNEFFSIKEIVMRRWVLCSDNRFYHSIVAEKALDAWIAKLEQRKKGRANNAKRWDKPFDPAEFDWKIAEANFLLASLNPNAKGLKKPGFYAGSNTTCISNSNTTCISNSNTTGNNTTGKKTSESTEKDTSGNTARSSAGNTDSNTIQDTKGIGREIGIGIYLKSCTEQGTSPSSVPAVSPGNPSSVNGDKPEPEERPAFQLEQQELPVDDPVTPFILLPQNDGNEYPVFEVNIAELEALYPAVDVRQHLRNMRGWLISNKRKRKTKDGMMSFVTSWLNKEQDKGGAGTAVTGAQRGSKMTQGKHSAFDQKDYQTGIGHDGSF